MDTPVCKFCGNAVMVGSDTANMTEDELIEIGTAHCSCDEAIKYQNRKLAAEGAKLELEDLCEEKNTNSGFKEVSPLVVKLLKKVIDLIADGKILKITLKIANAGTIDIGINAAGEKFTIQRSFTKKAKREVE